MRLQHIAFGLALLATAAPNVGNLGNFTTAVNQARTEAKRIGQDMTELQLSQQEAEQKNAVAVERYRSGCLPVVTPDQSQYVSLQLNSPVIDSASGQPIPVGSVVCDANGNTGVIVDDDQDDTTPGVTQKLAFTGDKAIITWRLGQYQGAAYSLPQN
jgi:hypothetical protein